MFAMRHALTAALFAASVGLTHAGAPGPGGNGRPGEGSDDTPRGSSSNAALTDAPKPSSAPPAGSRSTGVSREAPADPAAQSGFPESTDEGQPSRPSREPPQRRLNQPDTPMQGRLPISERDEAASGCERRVRDFSYTGEPVPIDVSPDHWAEVIFPGNLAGYLPDKPEGLDVRAMKIEQTDKASFRNRVDIKVDSADYSGIVKFHTEDGRSFHLRLQGGDCAELVARIHDGYYRNAEDGERTRPRGRPRTDTDYEPRERVSGMRLIDYLWLGEDVPDGYRKERVEGSRNDRLVFRQGSVYFYLEEIWRGTRKNKTGFVLVVENKGRNPFRVAIEQIDYSAERLRQTFGAVQAITMNPPDMRLGPAPEYAVDAMHPEHRGLLYIVAEK